MTDPQFTLMIVQIGVALLTLGAVFYYAGRHSEKLSHHGEAIAELQAGRTAMDQHLNRHNVQIAVLEREVLGSETNCAGD